MLPIITSVAISAQASGACAPCTFWFRLLRSSLFVAMSQPRFTQETYVVEPIASGECYPCGAPKRGKLSLKDGPLSRRWSACQPLAT